MKLFSKRSVAKPVGLLGIETGPQGIALAQVRSGTADQAPVLRLCEFLPGETSSHADMLRQAVAKHDLAGLSVNLLLHPAAYQMFLLEAPSVPANELRDAMRWRIKDMIDEPLDDVVVDCFALPDDAYRGRTRMVYCAVLSKARMAQFAALIHQAGLKLASIDITEMAFRNLGLLAGAQAINLAVLRLRTSEGLICVQSGADLYMARRIEHGLRQAAGDLSGMTLEIQRSLDYYESQLGKGYISRVLLLPMKQEGERTYQALANGLAVNLQRFDLRELFAGQAVGEMDEALQAFCVGAIGAALRRDAV